MSHADVSQGTGGGKTSYDQVPYASNPFPQTHPDRLATIASLLGMEPPSLAGCRVLELGCAGGGNLIPLAYSLPGGQFTGIDLSSRQVAEGQATVRALGLDNVTLRAADILDVTAELGVFDYIIAHGVYSWVPPQVQDHLLAICRQNLAPQGVAYVSYNTYPGWHFHNAVRDMMLYATRQADNPAESIAGAREMLDFLADSILAQANPHASFLHSYVHYVRERFLPDGDDAYLFHNELAEVNEPLYFYQFAERAAGHGLRYLADAQFSSMLVDNLPSPVAARLRERASTTVELEQYLDFLRNRTFRQSLLCHQEVKLTGKLAPERLADFYLASPTLPAEGSNPDLHSNSVDSFRGPTGLTLNINHPLTKAAMLHLSDIWPQAISFQELYASALARLTTAGSAATSPGDRRDDLYVLGANLVRAYSRDESLVEFHRYRSPFVREVSGRPIASPLARYQVTSGAETVTNLRHETVKVEGLGHHLIPYLDGTLSGPALVELLVGLVRKGQVTVDRATEGSADPLPLLPEMVEAALQTLARAALLVG